MNCVDLGVSQNGAAGSDGFADTNMSVQSTHIKSVGPEAGHAISDLINRNHRQTLSLLQYTAF